MKAVLMYLALTSVVAHGALLWFLFILAGIPIPQQAVDDVSLPEQFADITSGQSDAVGVIKDVSVLDVNNHKYVGYSIEFKGEPLFVNGAFGPQLSVGDEVGLLMSKHVFGEQKGATILVMPTRFEE